MSFDSRVWFPLMARVQAHLETLPTDDLRALLRRGGTAGGVGRWCRCQHPEFEPDPHPDHPLREEIAGLYRQVDPAYVRECIRIRAVAVLHARGACETPCLMGHPLENPDVE